MRSEPGIITRILVAICVFCSIAWNEATILAQESRLHTLGTKWDAEVSSSNCLSAYPRPEMVRTNWLNLNGRWEFGISPFSQTNAGVFSNTILVPFPVESSLSSAKHPLVTERQRMWYRRQFVIPDSWKGQRILLHFDAVDWETKAWLNGQELGTHRGGYDSFGFDITDALKPEGPQLLVVSVFDPTDSGAQPRGKQMEHSRPPFFSASSGIWQTVWMEPVPADYIVSLKLLPDVDADVLKTTIQIDGLTNGMAVEIFALDTKTEVAHVIALPNEECQVAIPHAKLWSPDTPFLYGLKIDLLRNGRHVDSVASYFGMRKISVGKSSNGLPQLMLNNLPIFELGPLDQGYWPDGIYTAPTDDALRYDIEVMKNLGFNMCRKHVKVEPERWYYWCDKLGLLVWQDMPNAGIPVPVQQKEIKPWLKYAHQFENELQLMVAQRGNHPCIVTWVLFNQGWGQYDTVRLTDLIGKEDPSRLVISASGWNDMKTGDIMSVHQYPLPAYVHNDGKRAAVVGECGALGLVVPGHAWGGVGHWNTMYFNDADGLQKGYASLILYLTDLKRKDGISAAVLTQLTDVETELDGFMTYDRAIVKMPASTVKELNESLLKSE